MSKAAFPIHRPTVPEGTVYAASMVVDDGMTLRDYFAAKAMHAFLLNSPPHLADELPLVWAEDAYEFADAMLEARGA